MSDTALYHCPVEKIVTSGILSCFKIDTTLLFTKTDTN